MKTTAFATVFTFLTALSAFSEIIQYEMVSEIKPRVDGGNTWLYTYTSKTNNISVPEGKTLQVIDFFSVFGWGRDNVITRIKSKYGTSTNFIDVWNVGNNTGSYATSPIGKMFVGPCFLEITLEDDRQNYIEKYNNWIPDGSRILYRFEMTDRAGSSSVQSSSIVPSASIVVPSNAVGDVDVLLEQSNDMITWTQCLPGTYNASTQKRFFRVRAVEK